MSLFATCLDQAARKHPNKRFALLPERVDSFEGALDISWEHLRKAVNKTAVWIDKTVGPAKNFPVVAFVSNSYDFRYLIFVIAMSKTGHKIFVPSPRNSNEFHLHLLKKLDCHQIVTSIPLGSWAEDCQIFQSPSLEELLNADDAPDYPYTKSYEEAKDDPVIVVHSSGSTGPPKPITWTNGYLEAAREMMVRDGLSKESIWYQTIRSGTDEGRMIAMPMFHSAGLLVGPFMTVYMDGAPLMLFPAKAVLQPASALKFIETFKPTTAFLPPSLLEDISSNEEDVTRLGALDFLCFGGAGIAQEAGDKIAKHVRIHSTIGTSETAAYPLMSSSVAPYVWFKFEELPGFDMQLQDDGLYELVFTREGNFNWPVFHVFPGIDEYATKDLYERHHDDPQMWRLIARKDDVLVLSNGEKVVPLPMEDIIRDAPEVHGVLYGGQGKFAVAALIELVESARSRSEEDIKAALKPFIERANAIAPAFAKLTLDMILFTHPDLPMRMTPKGTFIRRATLMSYNDEIEALYMKQDFATAVTLVRGLSETETVQALVEVFKKNTDKNIDPAVDLFQAAGIDSITVLNVTRALRISIQNESKKDAKVSPSLIYEHPTLNSLGVAVRSLVLSGSVDSGDHKGHTMQSMLFKYTEGLAASVSDAEHNLDNYNVAVTGTTGSLGSYMLHDLINDSAVSKIFALNRADDGEKRQVELMKSRGLSTDFKKVVFIKSLFGNSKLGLKSPDYELLQKETSLIIHNAWSVNFNQSLESFEPHVRGVRNFVDLAAASSLRPRIVFISTIGVFNAWDGYYAGKKRPEALVRDWRPAAGQGYSEGKYVSEHILAAAASRGVSSTVIRVGQVAGPVERMEGQWNKQEWLPSIIASSAYLGKLPSTFGSDETSWIPVDSMARAVVQLGQKDLADSGEYSISGSTTFYNLSNPHSGTFTELIPSIRKYFGDRIKEVVSYPDWVKALRTSAEDANNDATKNPGVKLADFYESLMEAEMSSAFDTDKAQKNSEAMARLHAVNAEWMEMWLKQWNF